MGLSQNVQIVCMLFFLSHLKVNADLKTSSRLLNYIPLSSSRETIINALGSKKVAIEVDGAFDTQVSIFAFSDPGKPHITIICRVASLSSADPILEYHVCRREIKLDRTLDKEDCRIASNGKYIFGQFKATHYSNGLNLTQDTSTDPSDGNFKLTASYSCILKNRFGISRSNWFRVTDVTQKSKDARDANRGNCVENRVQEPNVIGPADLPRTFECCKKPFQLDAHSLQQPQYGSIFSWKACTSNTKSPLTSTQCASTEDSDVSEVKLSEIGDYVILPTGFLVFLSFKTQPEPMSINLVCFPRDKPEEEHNYYGTGTGVAMSPFSINTRGSSYTGPILPKSSTFQDILFDQRRISETKFPYVLLALYKASENVVFEWKKDNKPLPNLFKPDKFRLTFPDVVDASLQGMYSLWLDGSEHFKYNVTIITVPYFISEKEITEEKFVIHGQSVNISFRLSHPGDKKTVYINGYDMKYDGSRPMEQLLAGNNIPEINYLKKLKAHLTILDDQSFKQSTHLEYRVNNMVDIITEAKCQSHTFTLGVENAYGESHINSVIKVLPYPAANEYPDKNSCKNSKCTPNTDMTIPCKFPMQNFLQEGAYPRLLWYLDGKLLDGNVENYTLDNNSTDVWKLNFDSERETLVISNISSKITECNVTCRLVLFYPAAEKLIPLSVDNFTEYQHLVIFDSESNEYIYKDRMTAYIRYDEPKLGNITWIIALVVVLMTLIIIIIILICYCRNREPKETYNVEDEERKQGHNPLKEIREKEEFHDYEREEDGHLLSDSMSPPLPGGPNYYSNERLASFDSTLRNNGTTSREPRVTYRKTASVEDEI